MKKAGQIDAFDCHLNDSRDADSNIKVQAVGPAVRNVRSPNLVLVDQVGSVSIPVLKTADRSVARRLVTVTGTHNSLI